MQVIFSADLFTRPVDSSSDANEVVEGFWLKRQVFTDTGAGLPWQAGGPSVSQVQRDWSVSIALAAFGSLWLRASGRGVSVFKDVGAIAPARRRWLDQAGAENGHVPWKNHQFLPPTYIRQGLGVGVVYRMYVFSFLSGRDVISYVFRRLTLVLHVQRWNTL